MKPWGIICGALEAPGSIYPAKILHEGPESVISFHSFHYFPNFIEVPLLEVIFKAIFICLRELFSTFLTFFSTRVWSFGSGNQFWQRTTRIFEFFTVFFFRRELEVLDLEVNFGGVRFGFLNFFSSQGFCCFPEIFELLISKFTYIPFFPRRNWSFRPGSQFRRRTARIFAI